MKNEIIYLRQLTQNNEELRKEIRREIEEEYSMEMAQEMVKKEKLLNLNNKKKLEKQQKEMQIKNEMEFNHRIANA